MPAVVDYAKTLSHVVYAEDNMYSCSEDGLQSLKEAIKNHSLNRVVVASCTPRTHAQLFQNACEDAGVNKYLFEFANIRDQCSWVHMKEPEKATEKAKDLVRMGVARAALLEPQVDSEIAVMPVSLVIGGGIAGMTAALNLANQGLDVHLIERTGELGGRLNQLDTLFPTDKKAIEVLEPIVEDVVSHPGIELHLNSVVEEVSGYIGNFRAIVSGGEIRAGTIIIATGADVLEPEGLYGYGEYPNVVTQLDFEEMLRQEEPLPDRVVMIQCAGARSDGDGWKPYCSRICCMVAIKNAKEVKTRSPKSTVHILYRDINASGARHEWYYHNAKGTGVKFIHFDPDSPPEIVGDEKATSVRVYFDTMGKEYEIPVDLVVLSTPLTPDSGTEKLSKILKVPLGQDGFFLEAHMKLRPAEFATDGIYLAGSAKWPTTIAEAVSQGCAAAAKAAAPMRKGTVKGEALYAYVDEHLCVGCGICEEVCEYGAPKLQENDLGLFTSQIIWKILCKGCGVCAVSCPSRAISMRHFRDDQISVQIDAALKELVD